MPRVLFSCAPLALAALVACEPAIPPPDPAPVEDAPDAPRDTEEEASFEVSDGALTLSVRRIEADGWRGRLVVASFAPERADVRVVPSESPRPLDAIVAPLAPRQPFAAIDGGFYDIDGTPLGLVRTEGRDVHALTDGGGSGVLLIGAGPPRIVHRDAYTASDDVREALQSIDRLVDEGRVLVSEQASSRRAARSAVAIDARGGVHLAVAFDDAAVELDEDARITLGAASASTGPTLREMAELLARAPREGGVGARQALGLDGGISTGMTVKSSARALRVEAYRGTIDVVLVSGS